MTLILKDQRGTIPSVAQCGVARGTIWEAIFIHPTTDYKLYAVDLNISRHGVIGNGTFDLVVSNAQSKPDSVALDTATIDCSGLSNSDPPTAAKQIPLNGYQISHLSNYWIIIKYPSGDASHYILDGADGTALTYYQAQSVDGGATWTLYRNDTYFRTYTSSPPPGPLFLGDIHIDQLKYRHTDRMLD